MFLKNRNIISKIKRSKVTDYAALRVKVTSCFVYNVVGLTFHDRINTQLIYQFELAQVVERRITKPQIIYLGSNLTGCSFLLSFFLFSGGGGTSDILILMSYFLSFYFIFYFYPFNMDKAHI